MCNKTNNPISNSLIKDILNSLKFESHIKTIMLECYINSGNISPYDLYFLSFNVTFKHSRFMFNLNDGIKYLKYNDEILKYLKEDIKLDKHYILLTEESCKDETNLNMIKIFQDILQSKLILKSLNLNISYASVFNYNKEFHKNL
jgi:hypothetical protein